jgi:nucleoside-diphosphate-sugar epimerase
MKNDPKIEPEAGVKRVLNGTELNASIIGPSDLILVTGATGFIGSRVVQSLADRGFRNLRCLIRPSCDAAKVTTLSTCRRDGTPLEVVRGNLLSREDCLAATAGVRVIIHLAAARGEKSIPDAFMNSVVTTRNLLDAAVHHQRLLRFVNISSFVVYTNTGKPQGRLLDETCPVEKHPELRGDAYCFAKVKQDEMVIDYGKQFGIPHVILRPGYVFGPGNEAITGRVGIGTFGLFLHLGGANTIPFTYVDNCADAIVLAAVRKGVDGEVFNVVDDNLPSSWTFLRLYKHQVRSFKSLYLPHAVSYALCWLWERYSASSEQQFPPLFNRMKWHAFWKNTRYSNARLKERLGWTPRVPMSEGLERYFASCRARQAHA